MKNSRDEDTPLQGLPVINQFLQLNVYLSTKKRVAMGEEPWNYTINERRERNYLGPWATNLYESFLCSVPWIIVFWVAGLFFETRDLGNIDATQKAVTIVYNQMNSVTSKILPPLFLMALAWIASFASLKPGDLTSESRKKSKHAYLYLDGSFGFLPQSLFVFGVSLALFVQTHQVAKEYSEVFIIIGVVIFYIAAFWNLLVVYYKIPRRLFKANGYNDKKPKSFRWIRKKDKDPNMGPWNRYTNYMVILAGLGLWIIAIVLAYLQISIAEIIVAYR